VFREAYMNQLNVLYNVNLLEKFYIADINKNRTPNFWTYWKEFERKRPYRIRNMYQYLPEETDKNRENVYIRHSDTPFRIGTSHHHSAESYRYSNLFGESVPFSKTNFSLLETNTAVGTNFSSPNCRPDLSHKHPPIL